jgi:hypothetical protein
MRCQEFFWFFWGGAFVAGAVPEPPLQDWRLKIEKSRIQESGFREGKSGNLKLEIGNWKLRTRSLGQFPFSNFHFLPRPVSNFQFPVSALLNPVSTGSAICPS